MHECFAGPVPQKVQQTQGEVSRLLSLSISLDTLEGMLENELTPPEVSLSSLPHPARWKMMQLGVASIYGSAPNLYNKLTFSRRFNHLVR